MREYYGRPEEPLTATSPAVTLGMFDGVHLGHRAVLARLRRVAAELDAEALVVTFDRHPRAVTDPAGAPPMITSLAHRLRLFALEGMDAALVLPFDEKLAGQSAEDFARELFVERLGARAVVLGHDAHFGRGRDGDLALLARMDEAAGIRTESVAPVEVGGRPVSSSAIRAAVGAGDLAAAAAMLGRPVSVFGTVTRGQGVGRTLGFPTLNLDPHHELHPPRGVYVGRTRVGESDWPSAINIGHRPTVDADGAKDVLLESHVLGGPVGELYGQTAEITFLERLRDEQRFPDRAALCAAIARDVATARARFGLPPEG